MIHQDRALVVDVDGTLCPIKQPDQEYGQLEPIYEMVQKLREYRAQGFYIILHTSRNMRTHDGNLGKINALTARVLLDWLAQHDIPYDEIYFGKPWPGRRGFYIDDRAIRPDEFLKLSLTEIERLIGRE